MLTINIGVTGTRYGCQIDQHISLYNILVRLAGLRRDAVLHHGDCIGVDNEAAIIADKLGFWIVAHPPNNKKYRAYAVGHAVMPEKGYHERDRDIVDMSHVLVACPDGPERDRSGTWYTVRYARQVDKPRIIVYPDGKAVFEKAE